MVGETYWSTGITLRAMRDDRWWAKLDFYDSGFCQDESTEGTLHTRYCVDLELAIDVLIADAKKIGIEFSRVGDGLPFLSYEGDGESKDWPPPDNWREVLREQAARVGWATYNDQDDENDL